MPRGGGYGAAKSAVSGCGEVLLFRTPANNMNVRASCVDDRGICCRMRRPDCSVASLYAFEYRPGPAISRDGRIVAFASTMTPDGSAMHAKVEPLAPGVFSFIASDSRGGSYFQSDAYHAGPAAPADAAHPAAPGEVLEIYATGLGRTNPPVAAGAAAPANPPTMTVVAPEVLVGSRAAQVLFSGLAPVLPACIRSTSSYRRR